MIPKSALRENYLSRIQNILRVQQVTRLREQLMDGLLAFIGLLLWAYLVAPSKTKKRSQSGNYTLFDRAVDQWRNNSRHHSDYDD